MDIVSDFAVPLPLDAGAELLAIPEADRPDVMTRVTDVMHTFSDGFTGTEAMARGERAVGELAAYLRPIVEARRLAPGDDAISAMLADETVDTDTVISLAMQLLMGIHEPITHTISVAMLALLRGDGLIARLRAEPALVPGAVDELMRYDGVAPFMTRTAVENIEIGGHTIPAGAKVLLMLPAANRDPDVFAAPDTLDIERRPNPHLAFGAGIHACPGAGIGRTTAIVAISALVTRLPGLRLADDPPVWREESNIRGLARLPVVFTPVAPADRVVGAGA
jgi:cytochrome P450